MNSNKRILIAFLLNIFFSVFEFAGGIFTGSVAILSDSLHDFGDAATIGISFFLEKLSNKKPDSRYTYGYRRYSVLGSVITTLVLILGSLLIVYNAIRRIISPTAINHDGMIIFAVVGITVNTLAAITTHGKESLNQKAVNLHMLEDVLGWVVVLAGAVVVKLTGLTIIDPILSIAVALFILASAISNIKSSMNVFLECAPDNVKIENIESALLRVDGVEDVHHLHLWTIDSVVNFATVHVVAKGNFPLVKEKVRKALFELGISHATIETESADEACSYRNCTFENHAFAHTHHHHH